MLCTKMPFQVNRVYTSFYGTLPGDSPLLVPVPTTKGYPQQRLHVLAAAGFTPLAEAAEKDLGFPLLGCSGWRPHRWTSWEQYVAFVTRKYGSLATGRKYLGFNSPHEVGLCIDLNCGGLSPTVATIPQQKQTKLYKWLEDNASTFGWTIYPVEAWHFEFNIPLADYKAGKKPDQPQQTAVETKPLIIQNDVCEDNTCFTSPLLDDGSSLVCK